jgi:hypothetical protein
MSGCAVAAASNVVAVGDFRIAATIDLPAQSRPLELTRLGSILHLAWIDVVDPGFGDQFVIAHGILLN